MSSMDFQFEIVPYGAIANPYQSQFWKPGVTIIGI